jgi:hypothetical protein
MTVRFRGKSGRAADITGTTEFGPYSDIGGRFLLRCTALTCCYTYSRDLWPWGTPHEASRVHIATRRRGRVAARSVGAAA